MSTDLDQLNRASLPGSRTDQSVRVPGVLPDRTVTVVQVEWHGTQALTLTYRDDAGKVDHELLYRANGRGSRSRMPVERGARRRRQTLPVGVRGPPDQAREPIRPVPALHTSKSRPAAASDPRLSTARCSRGSRCGSCSPMTRGRQDDHGRPADQELIVRGDVKRC